MPAGAATTIPDFTINGAGNGHGIGLSQYGSQGFALKGYTYDQILKHYFQGTTIVSAAKNPTVKVNLDKDGKARSSWTVRAVDTTLVVSWGSPTTTKSLAKNVDYTVVRSGSNVVVKKSDGTVMATGTSPLLLDPNGGDALFQIKDASGPPLNSSYPAGYPYMRWRGQLQLVSSGTSSLYAVNLATLKHYLYGVVPRESPSSWHAEALKAQAVAAHSYAKAKIDPTDVGASSATLRCTTTDQVYAGHSRLSGGSVVMHEATSTNNAVDATLGKLVKYGTKIVQTFFSSASGGKTANIEDSWGYTSPQPYYTGVSDPYEAEAGSPYMSWQVVKTGLQVASALAGSSTAKGELSNHPTAGSIPSGAGSSVWVSRIGIERGVSGYPRWVTFYWSNGGSAKLTSYTVKSALGLKSPNFSIGIPMERIQGEDRYATAVAISKRSFPGTATAAVIASGEDYPDALVGSAVAGARRGSLLLTRPSGMANAVAAELKRLKPAEVYLMGSDDVVYRAVENQVKGLLPSASVKRLGGSDRYETARVAANQMYAWKQPSKAIVVNGMSWPDAASASALAYAKCYPILLAKPASLGSAAESYLSARKPATYVVGGTTAVPKSVADRTAAVTAKTPTRLGGDNRYETSAAVGRQCLGTEGFAANDVYLTTSEDFPDALVGGVIAGLRSRPLILTQRDSCRPATASFLRQFKPTIDYVWVLGGQAAISDKGVASIEAALL